MTEELFSIQIATDADIAEMSKLLGDVFSRRDPPAMATKFSPSKLEQIAVIFGGKSAKEGLSIVAKDTTTREIIGAVLAHDFGAPPPDSIEEIVMENEPVIALLDGLEGKFAERHDISPGKFLHIFMIAVGDAQSKQGIARLLLQTCLENAAAVGYQVAFTEATNKISQGLFSSQMFTELHMERYGDFEFGGDKPFASIREHVGCALMEKQIG